MQKSPSDRSVLKQYDSVDIISKVKSSYKLGKGDQNKTLLSSYLPISPAFKVKNQQKKGTPSAKMKNTIKVGNTLLSSYFSSKSLKQTKYSSSSPNLLLNKKKSRFSIKLPNSFYNNDKNQLYLNRSQSMSEKSHCYRSKSIGMSTRVKLQSRKLEEIVTKRKIEMQNSQNDNMLKVYSVQHENSQAISSPVSKFKICSYQRSVSLKSQRNGSFSGRSKNSISNNQSQKNEKFSLTSREICSSKYSQQSAGKYHKLIFGRKQALKNQKHLQKYSSKIIENSQSFKWVSPHTQTNSIRTRFQDKKIVPGKVERRFSNPNPAQIKVLNLDRLFRKKEGKLTNVIPLPIPNMKNVSSRANVIIQVRSKDRIHDVIEQFNRLLKIQKLQNTKSKLGIKGKNFTKNPTIQELMGLKLKPKSKLIHQQSEEIKPEIFVEYCEFYKTQIRKNFALSHHLVEGLKQANKEINLDVFVRFYQIFVNKIASQQQKVKFLIYFFIPRNKTSISRKQTLRMLSLMCQNHSNKLKINTDSLSKEEQNTIFIQALARVLFRNYQEQDLQDTIDRKTLGYSLIQNEDIVEFLISLIQQQE